MLVVSTHVVRSFFETARSMSLPLDKLTTGLPDDLALTMGAAARFPGRSSPGYSRISRPCSAMHMHSGPSARPAWSEAGSALLGQPGSEVVLCSEPKGSTYLIAMLMRSADPSPIRRIPRILVDLPIVHRIRNAVESGAGRIVVEPRGETRDPHATILVLDDGPGLSGTARQRIFDPFFTTRHSAGARSLGSSVAHGITAEHGGQLEIERRAEGGTRALLRLARLDPAGASEGPPARSTASADPPATPATPATPASSSLGPGR